MTMCPAHAFVVHVAPVRVSEVAVVAVAVLVSPTTSPPIAAA
jgi:hypothetical protein